ncbi:MAG: lipid-A-disaccharide synthase, partial [Pseudomonadota bacterium]
MHTIGVIAGEASGSALGADLLRALKRRRDDLNFVGVGGDDMAAEGLEQWLPARELAVMGLAEVIRHLPRLLRHRRTLRRRFEAARPDVFVGIDLPDFNLSVARWLRERGIQTVQYVSPSVWAWREKRVEGIARSVDEVLCLLPFEPDFYASHQVAARFVGHPLADQIPDAQPKAPARERLGLAATDRVVAVLPGSRRGEIERTADVFAEAMRRVRDALPDTRIVVPVADAPLGDELRARFAAHLPADAMLWLDRQAGDAMAAADSVLLASGTATLEGMLIGRPMVVGYRLAAATSFLIRRMNLVKVKHFSLPNLLADAPLVPELMQEALTPDAVADAVLSQLRSPDGNAAMLGRFDQLRDILAN